MHGMIDKKRKTLKSYIFLFYTLLLILRFLSSVIKKRSNHFPRSKNNLIYNGTLRTIRDEDRILTEF